MPKPSNEVLQEYLQSVLDTDPTGATQACRKLKSFKGFVNQQQEKKIDAALEKACAHWGDTNENNWGM